MAGKKGMKGGMKGSRKYSKRPNPNMMMQGDGKIWDTIKNVGSKVNQFLKDTKILSTVAGLVPPSTPYVGAIAQPASVALKSLGYGKRQRGRGPSQIVGIPNMVGGADGIQGINSLIGNGKKLAKLNF